MSRVLLNFPIPSLAQTKQVPKNNPPPKLTNEQRTRSLAQSSSSLYEDSKKELSKQVTRVASQGNLNQGFSMAPISENHKTISKESVLPSVAALRERPRTKSPFKKAEEVRNSLRPIIKKTSPNNTLVKSSNPLVSNNPLVTKSTPSMPGQNPLLPNKTPKSGSLIKNTLNSLKSAMSSAVLNEKPQKMTKPTTNPLLAGRNSLELREESTPKITKSHNLITTEPLNDEPAYTVTRRTQQSSATKQERFEKAKSLNIDEMQREFKVDASTNSHTSLGLSLKDRQAMLRESFNRDQSPGLNKSREDIVRPKTPTSKIASQLNTGFGYGNVRLKKN